MSPERFVLKLLANAELEVDANRTNNAITAAAAKQKRTVLIFRYIRIPPITINPAAITATKLRIAIEFVVASAFAMAAYPALLVPWAIANSHGTRNISTIEIPLREIYQNWKNTHAANVAENPIPGFKTRL